MVRPALARATEAHRYLAILVLLIVIMDLGGPTAHAGEPLPVAKIADVQSPRVVSPGQSFMVVVAVDYSGSYSTDVAILDAPTGFVLASKGLIIPAGRNLFTFPLTGRDQIGVWSLVAAVRVWWHDGWYASQDRATLRFEITISVPAPALAFLRIRSSLAGATVTIDRVPYTVSPRGIELSAKRGPHTIEAESPIILGNDTRVIFHHWSDSVRSSRRDVYVAETLDLEAIYATEFLLTVESNIGETVGSGWYPAGANVTFAALNPAMDEHPTVGPSLTYRFSRWSGDSESSSQVAWVLMSGPKRVIANWSGETPQPAPMYQLVIVSMIFLSCSAMLIAIAFALRRTLRTRPQSHTPTTRAGLRGLVLLLMFLIAFTYSPAFQRTEALAMLQPETVRIGDASWYLWHQATSDTLLIWLGGGVVEPMRLLVNQYEFESYNTRRFIQELAGHYDVLALKEGYLSSPDPELNRTISREPYPGSNNYMTKIRLWANEQGYRYRYVVGYSVGAMVAAEELILKGPEKWTSPNGLIIITTIIPQRASSEAASLRASLLLLYGGKVAREFTSSGQDFFQRAPGEGWKNGFWYHKEYHMIPEVEHEVWTVMESGEYDSRAAMLTVKFIETSKSLQFEPLKDSISRIALNLSDTTLQYSSLDVRIVSAVSPRRVRTGEAFKIAATVRYHLPSNTTLAVIAFDANAGSIASASERMLSGSGETQFVFNLLSGDESRTHRHRLIPLVSSGSSWSAVAQGSTDVVTEVSNSFRVTVIAGYPGVPVQVDNRTYWTRTDGRIEFNVTTVEHDISVPPIIVLGNTSRCVFQEWNGTVFSRSMRLTPSGDLSLLAIYRRQYFLNVSSPFGQTMGSGWYDEGAAAQFSVTPPVKAGNVTHVFVRWSGDSEEISPASFVLMNRPKNVRALWMDLKSGERSAGPTEVRGPVQSEPLLISSLVVLLGSAVFLCASIRSRRKTTSVE